MAPSRAEFRPAEIRLRRYRRPAPAKVTSSRCPSIDPHLGEWRVVLDQNGPELDRRLALHRELEAEAPSTGLRIGLGHEIDDLGFLRAHLPLDAVRIDVFEL